MSNITKEEFQRACELRDRDYKMQMESISHDKDRLRIIEKQCDASNRSSDVTEQRNAILARFATVCETLVSPRFLVPLFLSIAALIALRFGLQ